jgi:EmrB/QacA subfamily drug resistance transporter
MQELTVTNQHNEETRDWPIILTAGVGLFLSTLDTGIMNVALPTLGRNFHASVSVVAWTVTLYLLSLSTTIVVFGRVSDRVGRLKVYSWGLIVFAIASILCGGAFSVPQLILFRGLQGIGAAMLQATSTAIITTCIPQERQGAALGTLGMILGLGPVLGPSVGGLLLSFAGWRYIFLINVPICLVGLWGILRLKRVTAEKHGQLPFNLLSNLLLGVAIFGILYGLSASSLHGFMRVLPFCLFALSFIGYIILEKRVSRPIVPLSLFKNGSFVVPILSVTVLGLTTAIAFIVPPYFLEQISLLAPWQVGLVNLASPLGLVALSRISGKRIGTWGVTRLMVAGLGLMLIALVILSRMQSDWPAISLVALLLLYGVGAGIFIPANLSAIMGSVGHELQGTIGAVQRMVQNIGIAMGTSVAASMIQFGSNMGTAGYMSAFREAWMVAAVAVLISLLGMGSLRLFR